MSSWNTFVKNSSFSRIFQIAALKMSSDNSFSKLLSSMLSLIPEPLNNPVYIKIYFVKCPYYYCNYYYYYYYYYYYLLKNLKYEKIDF